MSVSPADNWKNFNIKGRQLEAYDPGAQQQRHLRFSANRTATKQNTFDIPHAQPRYQPAGHIKGSDAHGYSARCAKCFVTPLYQRHYRLCRVRLQGCCRNCGSRRGLFSVAKAVKGRNQYTVRE